MFKVVKWITLPSNLWYSISYISWLHVLPENKSHICFFLSFWYILLALRYYVENNRWHMDAKNCQKKSAKSSRVYLYGLRAVTKWATHFYDFHNVLQVFVDVMIHFWRRGRENLKDLKRADFAAAVDGSGSRYVWPTKKQRTIRMMTVALKDGCMKLKVLNHFKILQCSASNIHWNYFIFRIKGIYKSRLFTILHSQTITF